METRIIFDYTAFRRGSTELHRENWNEILEVKQQMLKNELYLDEKAIS